jgi:hypothetical protein
MTSPTPNHCGTCTLCCKALGIEELDKPPEQWCSHCHIGHGCKVYATRPASCNTYECVWLTCKNNGNDIPDELRPDRCHTIIDYQGQEKIHHVRCDPHRTDAWRNPKVQALIKSLLDMPGEQVWLVRGDKRYRIRMHDLLEK